MLLFSAPGQRHMKSHTAPSPATRATQTEAASDKSCTWHRESCSAKPYWMQRNRGKLALPTIPLCALYLTHSEGENAPSYLRHSVTRSSRGPHCRTGDHPSRRHSRRGAFSGLAASQARRTNLHKHSKHLGALRDSPRKQGQDRPQTSAFRSQNGQQQYWAKRFFRIPETSTPPMSYRAAHRHLARRQKTKAPRISAKGLYEEPMSFCLYQAFAPSACIRRLPDIRGRGACIRYGLVTPTRLYARSIPLCSSLSKKQNYPELHDILTSSSVLYFADLLSA